MSLEAQQAGTYRLELKNRAWKAAEMARKKAHYGDVPMSVVLRDLATVALEMAETEKAHRLSQPNPSVPHCSTCGSSELICYCVRNTPTV